MSFLKNIKLSWAIAAIVVVGLLVISLGIGIGLGVTQLNKYDRTVDVESVYKINIEHNKEYENIDLNTKNTEAKGFVTTGYTEKKGFVFNRTEMNLTKLKTTYPWSITDIDAVFTEEYTYVNTDEKTELFGINTVMEGVTVTSKYGSSYAEEEVTEIVSGYYKGEGFYLNIISTVNDTEIEGTEEIPSGYSIIEADGLYAQKHVENTFGITQNEYGEYDTDYPLSPFTFLLT